MKRLSNTLPCDALSKIHKSFIRSHIDYGDIVHDKPINESFTCKLERVQYKACPAITGAIRGTPGERLNKELRLESLSDRRWVCKLTFFYKIMKRNSLQYLSDYLKGGNSVYDTRSANQITLNTFRTRTEKFKSLYFPFCISEWNKLSNLTKQAENIKKLKNILVRYQT